MYAFLILLKNILIAFELKKYYNRNITRKNI
jgi:hypothetical protein